MLGHGYWLRRFGGDRDVIGRSLTYDDGVATIVGVMPRTIDESIEIWRPLPPFRADEDQRRGWGGRIYARLQPGLTPADAEARLAGRLLPDARSSGLVTPRVASLLDETRDDYRTIVTVLAGAVGLILLIACVNVAGLLLARGATRGAELAIRASLGASKPHVLLALLGGLGLVLALVGVFGITSYAVARRTIEIGVRMAFGARPGQVVAKMLSDAAAPIALGTIIGIAGALAATRVIESFLFQTEPTDPATLVAVAVTLAASGCLAAWIPARRAARVDPVTALRAE